MDYKISKEQLQEILYDVRRNRNLTVDNFLKKLEPLNEKEGKHLTPCDPNESPDTEFLKKSANYDLIDEIQTGLSNAFSWVHSPQGAAYWELVYHNLDAIMDLIS